MIGCFEVVSGDWVLLNKYFDFKDEEYQNIIDSILNAYNRVFVSMMPFDDIMVFKVKV